MFPFEQITSSAAKEGVVQHFPALCESLGFTAAESSNLAGDLLDFLNPSSPEMLDKVGEFFAISGIQTQWRSALMKARADWLAGWIAPEIRGTTVLDLLCGDGAVGVQVSKAAQTSIHLVERQSQRGTVTRPWLNNIEEFSRFAIAKTRARFDTVLLCTVLHHEQDAERTLELAARSASERVVIVENCLEERYCADYHLLIDMLFNCSLYRTQLASPGEHRTSAEWCNLCSNFGTPRIVDRSIEVPGIPLAHTLIVVDMKAP